MENTWLVIKKKDTCDFNKNDMLNSMYYRRYNKDTNEFDVVSGLIRESEFYTDNTLNVCLSYRRYFSSDALLFATTEKFNILYRFLQMKRISDLHEDIKMHKPYLTQEEANFVEKIISDEIYRYTGIEVTYDTFIEYASNRIKNMYAIHDDEKYYEFSSWCDTYSESDSTNVLKQLSVLGVSLGEFMINPNYGVIYGNTELIIKLLDSNILNRDSIENIDLIDTIIECSRTGKSL